MSFTCTHGGPGAISSCVGILLPEWGFMATIGQRKRVALSLATEGRELI